MSGFETYDFNFNNNNPSDRIGNTFQHKNIDTNKMNATNIKQT
jgi:hypothetical protein